MESQQTAAERQRQQNASPLPSSASPSPPLPLSTSTSTHLAATSPAHDGHSELQPPAAIPPRLNPFPHTSQHHSHSHSHSHSGLHTLQTDTAGPPTSSASPVPHARTASSTPMTSPGLFSPVANRSKTNVPFHSVSDSNTPSTEVPSPFLHPLQNRKVRETHKALIDSDSITGRKLINQYEVIEEIGRGMHGKVKLARNLETGENVAIKIIPRYSKRRRLGKVMAMSPQDKTMREIAILKKMRHPNVVALLEIIDDPELKKIYLILEHVELGEVVWRKKGLPHICSYERRRIEAEMRGEVLTPSTDEEQYNQMMERRLALKELKRARMVQMQAGKHEFWSIEHGVADDGSNPSQSRVASADDLALSSRGNLSNTAIKSMSGSFQPNQDVPINRSTRHSRSQSTRSTVHKGQPFDFTDSGDEDDMETPGPTAALEGTMYGAYIEEGQSRTRAPSMADSIISHMSSVDWNTRDPDQLDDDFSYVPCFTFEQARSVFRDTVLGLEYLHYQGVVHRDIKPANLLWTKDHRVKISDFGVSYFGRPVRDGERDDETVSESEAQDFDDDLELAKTVGTPAFFAPELCYTDTDREEQPKISEMIDIWSLGVTLYCLIFARIPFQAKDEFAMFRKIATEDVFIPRRRLKPVDPATHPDGTSLYKRHNHPPYRDDNDQAYEDIDDELYDLLKLMFTKNPDRRIRLREIKRHPWITKDISNPIAWIDETDPARPSQGRRVQVNAKETAHAVVPITFLERALSGVKKAVGKVGKVMHPLVSERSDSRSRRRATSSVASSAGDSMQCAAPSTLNRDTRRKSLKPDDYFDVRDFAAAGDHPLSQSVGVSPQESTYDPLATAIAQPIPQALSSRHKMDQLRRDVEAFPSYQDAQASGGRPRYQDDQRTESGFLRLTEDRLEAHTAPATPYGYDMYGTLQDAREPSELAMQFEEAPRSQTQSVDQSLFASPDKRAQPKVGISTAMAPGTVLHRVANRPRPVRSIDLGKIKNNNSPGLSSPLLFSSQAITGYQHPHPQSDTRICEKNTEHQQLDERPQTAHRVESSRETPEFRTVFGPSTSAPKPSTLSQEVEQRQRVEEYQHKMAQQTAAARAQSDIDPADIPCPASPTGESPMGQVSREGTMETCKSSRSTSMAGLTTPLTSPSEVASPISSSNFPSKEEMVPYQSDPSLPALLSGASSISADAEAELPVQYMTGAPRTELLETTDSLTPPAFTKEPVAGFPLEHIEHQAGIDEVITLPLDDARVRDGTPSSTPGFRSEEDYDEDDDASDSDEGLVMARSSKKKTVSPSPNRAGAPHLGVRRRDTSASVASTDTAKRYDAYARSASPPNDEQT